MIIAISRATAGLLAPTLLISPVVFVPMWLILGKWGGLGLKDFDLDWSKIGTGLAATASFWGIMQLVQVGLAVRSGRSIELHGSLAVPGVTFVLGRLVGQLFANALFEEMVFRRFAISQLMGYWERLKPAWFRLILVVIVTQFFFWAFHFPLVLSRGMPVSELISKTDIILTGGFIVTWIYFQTRNLFICIGYHALSNAPAPLVAESTNAFGLVRESAIGLLLLHLAWLLIFRRKDRAA